MLLGQALGAGIAIHVKVIVSGKGKAAQIVTMFLCLHTETIHIRTPSALNTRLRVLAAKFEHLSAAFQHTLIPYGLHHFSQFRFKIRRL